MKCNRFFLCNSSLDSADVTHSLTLSDHVSVFNSKNRATAILAGIKSLATFSDVDSTGLHREIHLASFASAQNWCSQGTVSVTHCCFPSRAQGGAEEEGKKYRSDLSELSWRCGENFFPRCLGAIKESRFAHKADELPWPWAGVEVRPSGRALQLHIW